MNRCREREELEKEIHRIVRELARNAREAAKVAVGGGQQKRFEDLRDNHSLLSERLTVLKHCLELHRQSHGCDGS
jgi:hypothetical protein